MGLRWGITMLAAVWRYCTRSMQDRAIWSWKHLYFCGLSGTAQRYTVDRRFDRRIYFTTRFDPDRHHRRSIRLHGYDYAQAGAYFVTICTRERELFFADPELAEIVTTVWFSLPERFPTITLDAFVVMPNHVHFIVFLEVSQVGASFNDAPTTQLFQRPRWDKHTPALGEIIRTFKAGNTTDSPAIPRHTFRVAAQLLRTHPAQRLGARCCSYLYREQPPDVAG